MKDNAVHTNTRDFSYEDCAKCSELFVGGFAKKKESDLELASENVAAFLENWFQGFGTGVSCCCHCVSGSGVSM